MSQGINMFYAFFDSEGYIIANEWNGNKRIGVSLGKFNNMEKAANAAIEKAKAYREMLEERGILQKEMTPEERMAALSEQMQALASIVEQQSQIINSLKQESKGGVVVPEVIPPQQQGMKKEGGANGGSANNPGSSAGFIARK